MQTPIAAKT